MQICQAVWRVYGWTEQAITFGYSQEWGHVCAAMPGFAGVRIRRMTGGGIVDHRNDLTYALTIPNGHAAFRTPAMELYRQLHLRIADILMEYGIRAEVAPCPGKCGDAVPARPASLCFKAPEPYDVIDPLSGAKIAGAAMKRNRTGLLIQGSLHRSLLGGLAASLFEDELGQRLALWLQLEPVCFKGTLPALVYRQSPHLDCIQIMQTDHAQTA